MISKKVSFQGGMGQGRQRLLPFKNNRKGEKKQGRRHKGTKGQRYKGKMKRQKAKGEKKRKWLDIKRNSLQLISAATYFLLHP
jgi:hypothetical protein